MPHELMRAASIRAMQARLEESEGDVVPVHSGGMNSLAYQTSRSQTIGTDLRDAGP